MNYQGVFGLRKLNFMKYFVASLEKLKKKIKVLREQKTELSIQGVLANTYSTVRIARVLMTLA